MEIMMENLHLHHFHFNLMGIIGPMSKLVTNLFTMRQFMLLKGITLVSVLLRQWLISFLLSQHLKFVVWILICIVMLIPIMLCSWTEELLMVPTKLSGIKIYLNIILLLFVLVFDPMSVVESEIRIKDVSCI